MLKTLFLFVVKDNVILYEAAKGKETYKDMVRACKLTLTGSIKKWLRKRRNEIRLTLQQPDNSNEFLAALLTAISMNNELIALGFEDGVT